MPKLPLPPIPSLPPPPELRTPIRLMREFFRDARREIRDAVTEVKGFGKDIREE